jgi:hypothetical protein
MNINRNNYEEFFLLYVDNELSAAERNAVELFVHENLDLKEELNMLLQTVISADAVSFDNKSNLFKEEFTALQENLLLYIDNELSADEKLDTEKILQADYSALKELGILQQTKLQPETIVFADKQSLYRKERARVIDLPWRRIAAAAVLIGFGTWATISFMKVDKTKVEVATTGGETKRVTAKPEANTIATIAQQPAIVAGTNTTTAGIVPEKQPGQKNNLAVHNKEEQTIQQTNNATLIAQEIKKPDHNSPERYSENINIGERNKNDIGLVTTKNTATEQINSGKNNPVDVNENSNSGVVDGYALRTNFTEGDADNNLSPEDDKGKKIKLGGFFRKVKRLVDRNTNVTNGNGIKVAGFDIAIK